MSEPYNLQTYANFGVMNAFREVVHALRERTKTDDAVAVALERIHRDEQRISQALGKPVRQLDILEIGGGQQMERARYFGINNQVTAIDLDVIPCGFDIASYLRMFQENGFGRLAKTLGRKLLLVDRTKQLAWQKALGISKLPNPTFMQGDICQATPKPEAYDVVVSWSTFEHLSDPKIALKHAIQSLRPGGVLYIGIHLYTSNSGHHDLRAFTGFPLPLWAHLRASTSDSIEPSSYLNEWRLSQWRSLFEQEAKGFEEFLESYGSEQDLTLDIRGELSEYSDEELCTVDAFYVWQKPIARSN
ncbi:MAG: class I SAM-dependent methyltransferase [Microcoleus sp. PH2017_22_RUC_O_B]|uniref:class I SAM-dependent methyltransferase n=1 Tax=unclassified Microcoleus TaxID=2642155 RepID=UPI001D9C0C2B|nr:MULTISPECIES: class I SAM-dependent methyltransferase [unclassified Microcoleus]MCC3526539.1 class I SAM-dependent methyltransferase [Microcoleus sp. PH2017_21_RUC_O_A]MCC3538833.1 class I SAM-dependent methyltransferase [Microcoleus sp. PH2017_22_RUC_O_B]